MLTIAIQSIYKNDYAYPSVLVVLNAFYGGLTMYCITKHRNTSQSALWCQTIETCLHTLKIALIVKIILRIKILGADTTNTFVR